MSKELIDEIENLDHKITQMVYKRAVKAIKAKEEKPPKPFIHHEKEKITINHIDWSQVDDIAKNIAPYEMAETQGSDFTREETFKIYADAMTDDEVPALSDEMIRPDPNSATTTANSWYNPDIWRIIDQALGDTTKKKYNRYHKLYDDYCTNSAMRPESENTVVFFFKWHLDKKRFGIGSVWSVYSCVNHLFAKRWGKNLNTFLALRMFLKALTKWYVPKKSDIIKTEDVQRLFKSFNQ